MLRKERPLAEKSDAARRMLYFENKVKAAAEHFTGEPVPALAATGRFQVAAKRIKNRILPLAKILDPREQRQTGVPLDFRLMNHRRSGVRATVSHGIN